MATPPTTTAINEALLSEHLANVVELIVQPVHRQAIILKELVNFKTQSETNLISRTVLRRFNWRKMKRTCPVAGNVQQLSVRNPDYGKNVIVDFLIIDDPTVGVVVGRPACQQILETWTEATRVCWLRMIRNNNRGILATPYYCACCLLL